MFSFAKMTMRVFRSHVGSIILNMRNIWHYFTFCCGITSKFISYNAFWSVFKICEQLFEKAFFCFFIPPFCHKNIQLLTVFIDSTPEINFLSIDLKKHLIEVSGRSRFCFITPDFVGILYCKITPLTHCWCGNRIRVKSPVAYF